MSLSTAQRDPHHGTTSSSRLKRFYKRFGFVENKGRSYDPSISDNMIRPARTAPRLSEEAVSTGGAARLPQAQTELRAIRAALPRGSKFRFTLEHDLLILHMLHLPPESRGGVGTKTLQRIVAVADRHELRAKLVADPTDEPGDPDLATLVRWYGRFGFQQTGIDRDTGSPIMERQPHGSARLSEELAFTVHDRYRNERVPVWKNPDPGELRAAFREHGSLRAIIEDGTDDLYVWDAELTHDYIRRAGETILLRPRAVRLKWYDEDGTPEEWQERKQEFAARAGNVWRAYGRQMPIIADNGEHM
jgi:hypothetical protein